MTTQTTIDLQIIVPNLERRTDRWNACFSKLESAGVPRPVITRHSAHDYKEIESYPESALRRQFGSVPAWLNEDKWNYSASNFAWCWTWYEILEHISRCTTPNTLYMILIDDMQLLMPYEQLTHSTTALAAHHTVNVIFAGRHWLEPEEKPIVRIKDNPAFQFGLYAPNDSGTIFSPNGATAMIQWANLIAEPYDPWKLTIHIKHYLNNPNYIHLNGIFSPSDLFTFEPLKPKPGWVEQLTPPFPSDRGATDPR